MRHCRYEGTWNVTCLQSSFVHLIYIFDVDVEVAGYWFVAEIRITHHDYRTTNPYLSVTDKAVLLVYHAAFFFCVKRTFQEVNKLRHTIHDQVRSDSPVASRNGLDVILN